ncbi:hypothetical protein [Pedobacter chitinilyticus]|uniref:Uncharacterized protein n=1 Tax=Pedobacter chitinilyticus TaxID=2233776 RepID=A0A3S3PPV6_9SPHI|nr:hypothetical protein [Pedobacter chitinilyticus]RWU10134.1 hypothetical protein DPV69_01960 [Pedobacter chitinilyticus]
MKKKPSLAATCCKSLFVKKILLLTALLFVGTLAQAQILAWQFALPEPTKGVEPSITATTTHEFLETSLLTRGKGVLPKQGNSRGFSGNFGVDENFNDAQKSESYFQFEIKPKKGHQVSLSSLKATLRRQEQSAHLYRWTYSLDGKNFIKIGEDVDITSTNNNGVAQAPIDLSTIRDLQNVNKPIILRLYAWGGLTNQGKAIAFGFGKSDAKGSNALVLEGTIVKK